MVTNGMGSAAFLEGAGAVNGVDFRRGPREMATRGEPGANGVNTRAAAASAGAGGAVCHAVRGAAIWFAAVPPLGLGRPGAGLPAPGGRSS